MSEIFVHPPVPQGGPAVTIASGGRLTFGRGAPGVPVDLTLAHPAVSRLAGEIAADRTYWHLSNFSSSATFLVQNPEGAGEYFKVGPGRVYVPVPFEIATLVVPAGHDLLSLQVFAPAQPEMNRSGEAPGSNGGTTTFTFPLDESAKYFRILLALCEPRLRGNIFAPLPTVGEIVRRLRPLPGYEMLSERAVDFHIDYMARAKLRLREPDPCGAPRFSGRREAVASFVLRFGLVSEDHLDLLPLPAAQRIDRPASGRPLPPSHAPVPR